MDYEIRLNYNYLYYHKSLNENYSCNSRIPNGHFNAALCTVSVFTKVELFFQPNQNNLKQYLKVKIGLTRKLLETFTSSNEPNIFLVFKIPVKVTNTILLIEFNIQLRFTKTDSHYKYNSDIINRIMFKDIQVLQKTKSVDTSNTNSRSSEYTNTKNYILYVLSKSLNRFHMTIQAFLIYEWH